MLSLSSDRFGAQNFFFKAKMYFGGLVIGYQLVLVAAKLALAAYIVYTFPPVHDLFQ